MKGTTILIILNVLILTNVLLLPLDSSSYEIQKVDDMKIEMEVKEIVHAICKKTPFTKTSRCVRKKLKCINKDYSQGAELENAVMDCF